VTLYQKSRDYGFARRFLAKKMAIARAAGSSQTSGERGELAWKLVSLTAVGPTLFPTAQSEKALKALRVMLFVVKLLMAQSQTCPLPV
jgi:hypothetical protein